MVCAVLTVCCARPPLPDDLQAPGRSTISRADTVHDSPPAAPPDLIELPVEKHLPAVVSVPTKGASPRPVLVATHGAGDLPEWQCTIWGGIVGHRGFVLCPRGFAIDRRNPDMGYFYTEHHSLGREMTAALQSLSMRFAGRVDMEAPVFAGYSQGAMMGAVLLPHHPARFSRAALIEGGNGSLREWSVPAAQKFHQHGGIRVLLACGNPVCASRSQDTARLLSQGGLTTRVVHAEGAGHTYGGSMEVALREAFEWLVEGDARWY